IAGGAAELKMAVAEDDHRWARSRQELRVPVGCLRTKRLHVGPRRGVAEKDLVDLNRGRERCELVYHLLAEPPRAVGDRLLDQFLVRRVRGICGPALAVAADPGRIELAQA